MQERADLPEEDPDVKGGGQVHDEHRVAKVEDVGDQGLVPGEDPVPAAGGAGGAGGASAGEGVKVEAGEMAAASLETSEALKGGSRGSPTPPANPAPDASAGEPMAVDKAAPAKGMMDLLGDDGDI